MLQIVDKYGIPSLKELCEESLSESLTVANVIDLGILAEKMEANELIKNIVKFYKEQFGCSFWTGWYKKTVKDNTICLYKLK